MCSVPVENLIGEENKGWTYAKYLLGHERTNIAGVGTLQARTGVPEARRRRRKPRTASRCCEDPVFAAKVAQLEIDLMALEITSAARAVGRSEAPRARARKRRC